ncbi:hypothetical protein [Acidiplasma cupricumulans]|uniref:hypothetical protein n=1 Tax=Acidiplasma cupricumulans TaxID=312540 RepID=UPI0007857348|nr:hypothetical protein [Acidiplasma cupricumulans]
MILKGGLNDFSDFVYIKCFYLRFDVSFCNYFAILINKNYNSWNHSLGNPVNGRNVIILITTKGEAQEVVANIIKTLKSYSINTRIIVLTEYYDLYRYDAEILRVPADYKTKNGSKNKQRALQYYSEWLLKNNIGSIHIHFI